MLESVKCLMRQVLPVTGEWWVIKIVFVEIVHVPHSTQNASLFRSSHEFIHSCLSKQGQELPMERTKLLRADLEDGLCKDCESASGTERSQCFRGFLAISKVHPCKWSPRQRIHCKVDLVPGEREK